MKNINNMLTACAIIGLIWGISLVCLESQSKEYHRTNGEITSKVLIKELMKINIKQDSILKTYDYDPADSIGIR